jgi:hypothetical protein
VNKLLADSLAFINALIAFINILVCAGVGLYLMNWYGQVHLGLVNDKFVWNTVGMVLGGLVGFVWSVLVNGVLALLIDIRNELRLARTTRGTP